MKRSTIYLFSILFLLFFLGSCTFTKRQHKKGYHTEFVKNKTRNIKHKSPRFVEISDTTKVYIISNLKEENLEANLDSENDLQAIPTTQFRLTQQNKETQNIIGQSPKDILIENQDLSYDLLNKQQQVTIHTKKPSVFEQVKLKPSTELAITGLFSFIVGYILISTSKSGALEVLLGYALIYIGALSLAAAILLFLLGLLFIFG